MEYIFTFFTHSAAVKFEKIAKNKGIPVELMPSPRRFTSNCGISAKIKYDGNVNELMMDDIESIYNIKGKDDILIYRG